MARNQKRSTSLRQLFYGALGWLFFVIGIVGVFLPVLPTTPFLLLALWGFSKSSRRLHDYLYFHPRYGRLLREWKEHHAIPLQAKLLAVTMMGLSAAYLIFFSTAPLIGIIAVVTTMVVGAGFILTRSTSRKQA